MAEYMKEVVRELPQVIMTMVMTDIWVNMDKYDILSTFQWYTVKVKVLTMVHTMSIPQAAWGLMPFLIRSAYLHMVQHLKLISDSLKEVHCICFHAFLFPMYVLTVISCSFAADGSP